MGPIVSTSRATGLPATKRQRQAVTKSGLENKARQDSFVRHAIPDSYIVMAPKAKWATLASQGTNAELLGSTHDTSFMLMRGPQPSHLADVDGVRVFPNYEYDGPMTDQPIPGSALTEAPHEGLPRHLEVIDIEKAWAVTQGSPSALSAITDTGVDSSHPQLKDTFWTNPKEIAGNGVDDDGNGKIDDVHGWDFSDADGQAEDAEGLHHTHVHGIVHAAPGQGVAGIAPGAKGMALRIGGGKRRYSSAVMVESYLYALNQGAKSINTSLNVDAFVGDRAIEATYRELADNDVLLFNSAGNDGRRDPKRGRLDDIVLVASTQIAPESVDVKSDFSNYGYGIDIACPGSDILSTLPGGRVGALSGTSMASPVAMGVDLLVQSAHPDWNRAQRWAQIAGTADSLAAANPEQIGEMGYGRINAGRALTETVAPPTITVKPTTFPNGQTMDILVRFDKVLDPAAANNREAWKIINEEGETVRQGAPKEVRLMTNQIQFNVADLPKGHYRFIASASTLQDPFGQALDGNKDGVPGDDIVVDFQRIT